MRLSPSDVEPTMVSYRLWRPGAIQKRIRNAFVWISRTIAAIARYRDEEMKKAAFQLIGYL